MEFTSRFLEGSGSCWVRLRWWCRLLFVLPGVSMLVIAAWFVASFNGVVLLVFGNGLVNM
ncbi:uncharacterized protein K452DRAFT_292268 [Aplosporella prunicola CBS 121167]|uniref:Uncharacterized protein n=1 Tax=Aplosporella prunicola CBS 121167 TaxID=1176127 RepID=A0A6A6B1K2_9PEZI|nr:uncharacterized protein K452DRAFT_292268 [Aplosporella prunicola CBS 121167]KAF2136611.1 hypothetical protein K452DRAFT_292268 [Aplosporella prunicola CBS 121167]